MNIILQTNNEALQLELRDVKKIGHDYRCILVVESRGFCAHRTFYFDESNLKLFCCDLTKMNRTLAGQAKLKQLFEDDYICLKMAGGGHVIVAGLLVEYSEYAQRLEFRFQSDQTILTPLLEGMSKLSCSSTDET